MCKTVLCVDIGTTSLKSALITKTGEVVSFSVCKIKDYEEGYIAKVWLSSFYKTIHSISKDLLKKSINVEILAFCVSGNGPTVVTKNGRTVLWNQKIQTEENQNKQSQSLFLPKILFLKQMYSKEYAESDYLFSGPEFFIYELTKKIITILPEKRFINAYWTKKQCKEFDINIKKLPRFVKIGANCGNVSNQILEKINQLENQNINFTKRTPVFAGGPDFIVALIGTNSLQKGRLCDRCGSSEGLNFCIEKQIIDKKLRTLPSVIKNLWNVSYLIENSGTMDKSQKLNELKNAFEYIKKIFTQNNIEFPKTMAITGGQINDTQFAKLKGKTLGVKIMIPLLQGFNHNELLGDACIAFTSLKEYKNLIEAAKIIVQEKELI